MIRYFRDIIMTREQLKQYLKDHGYPNGRAISSKRHKEARRKLFEYTSFLDHTNLGISVRLYCIVNDIYNLPSCVECGNEVQIVSQRKTDEYEGPYKNGRLNIFCSNPCSVKHGMLRTIKENGHWTQDKDKLDQFQDEYERKYGVRHHTQKGNWSDILGRSYKEKTGYSHWTQNPDWIESQKAKNLEEFGYEFNIQRPDVRQNIISTFIKNYGTSVPIAYNNNVKEKSSKTKIKKYGSSHYKSSIEYKMGIAHSIIDIELLNGERDNRHYKIRNIPDSTLELISNKTDLEDFYNKNRKLTCAEIGKMLDISASYFMKALRNHGIEVNRSHTQSAAEREICEFLDYHNIPYIQNTRRIISPKELDIYIPKFNFAIEYNGLYHHSDTNRERRFHQKKSLECMENNILLLHIYEHQWNNFETSEKIKEKILRRCKQSSLDRVYARNCYIGTPLYTSDIKEVYNSSHLQGYKHCSVTYALYYENEIVACMGFKLDGTSVVLERYATTMNVIGGFSKLLKAFIRDNKEKYESIVTFANLDYSHGDIYKDSGFKLEYITPPNYIYFKGNKILSRQQAMKHKLPKLLGDKFDENKTEYENMIDNGYRRVFDSGSIKFRLDLKEKGLN